MDAPAATLIHEARMRAGMSQRELARCARTSQAVISAYENGQRDPGFETLRRILAATGHRLKTRLVLEQREFPVLRAVDDPDEDDRLREHIKMSPREKLARLEAMRTFASRHRGRLISK